MTPNPFDINQSQPYRQWRAQKLEWLQSGTQVSIHHLPSTQDLSPSQKHSIQECCKQYGFAVYALPEGAQGDKTWLLTLAAQFGLHHIDSNLCADEDSVTSLQVLKGGQQKTYIPYSNKPLNWHTDGYYNASGKRIQSFLLHCASDAETGGENGLMDTELAYIRLRDENPDYIRALMHPEALSIPPNQTGENLIRDTETGPVFSIAPQTGCLLTRYTARKRYIHWREDETTLEAVAFLQNLLTSGENGVVRYRLSPGQGIICNNVLHCRTGFKDSPNKQRLYFRARYYDRVGETCRHPTSY